MLTVDELSLIVFVIESKINHDEIMIQSFMNKTQCKHKTKPIIEQEELIKELKKIICKLNITIDELETM